MALGSAEFGDRCSSLVVVVDSWPRSLRTAGRWEQVLFYHVLVREEAVLQNTWAAGVAPSLHSLALVVLQSMQCCHDPAVSKQAARNEIGLRPFFHKLDAILLQSE